MDLQLVAEDLWFPEGPVILADGSVLLVEIRRQTLSRVAPDGRRETVAELGGGPNGVAIGPDGAVYVCNNGGAFAWQDTWDYHLPGEHPATYKGGSIQRVDIKTGAFTTLYDHCDGKPLNAPNDLVFDSTGGFWFTCFDWSDGEARRMGALYYARADGSKIVRWRHDVVAPNGVGLSPDETTVYMADCMNGRLYAMELTAPGEMAPPPTPDPGRIGHVVATLPGYQWLDSLAVQADGRVAVGTLFNGGITVFDPRDGAYEHIPCPDPVTTNICFGGADMRDAWITCAMTGKLYKCRWPSAGLKLPFNA